MTPKAQFVVGLVAGVVLHQMTTVNQTAVGSIQAGAFNGLSSMAVTSLAGGSFYSMGTGLGLGSLLAGAYRLLLEES